MPATVEPLEKLKELFGEVRCLDTEEGMKFSEATGVNISISNNKKRLHLGSDPRADDSPGHCVRVW